LSFRALEESTVEIDDPEVEGVWRARSGALGSVRSTAKKQQHFKTIVCVRSASSELTASRVTKKVTASLGQKPLFGDRNALSKRDYTRRAVNTCLEICIERIDFSDGERLGAKQYL
jgi:hypothetical protein